MKHRCGTWIYGVTIILFCMAVGCAKQLEEKKMVAKPPAEEHHDGETLSCDYRLSSADLKQFQRGRSKKDILDSVRWRGNCEMAAVYNGADVMGVSFGLFGGPLGEDPRGMLVWAIFIDDSFDKFVNDPPGNQEPIKVGEFPEIANVVVSPAISIGDLENMQAGPTRSGTDPGLTFAWLMIGSAIENARKPGIKRNAVLRDQFNAARLKLRMTEQEVQEVFRADPIEAGKYAQGTWKIYGARDEVDVMEYLHYSNVLVLFESGRLNGIYSGWSVPGGEDGLRSLRETVMIHGGKRCTFSDLPSSSDTVR